MARNKRASMREGPLAALFRRTDDSQPADRAERQEPQPGEAASPPSTAAAQDRAQASQVPIVNGQVVQGRVADRHVTPPTTPLPTPKERLQEAFSTEIPHNLMERGRQSAQRPDPTVVTPQSVTKPVLRVVGIGGAGVNAINRMIEAGVDGVEFLAVNTDVQSLQQSAADVTVHIGEAMTRGLGAGSDPRIGRRSAEEDRDKLKSLLKGSDMVFITGGEGGGTGSGAAPVVASVAQDIGALTVGVVTKPFTFEGSRRMSQAQGGIEELRRYVDTLIVIPNNRLLSTLDQTTSMVDAFRFADDVLRQGIQGISDLVTLPGLINLDFADVRTIMSEAGDALLGIGMGVGEQRAFEAARAAVASPLLETSVNGARSILLSITGGVDLSLWEVNDAAKAVGEAAHADANIIFGAMVDEKVGDQVWVTVVATGYGASSSRRGQPAADRQERPRHGRDDPGERAKEAIARSSNTPAKLSEIDVPEFIPRG